MSTNCKLIFGYTDHTGNWNVEKEYYRHYDGYSEAIIDLLKAFTSTEKGVDVEAINKIAKYDGHKFEEIEAYGFGDCNYHYYIDESNRAKIICTVLKEDGEFFNKYNVMNMVVEQELILND